MDAKTTIRNALLKNLKQIGAFRSNATYLERSGKTYDPIDGSVDYAKSDERDFIGVFVSALDVTIADSPFLQEDIKSIVFVDEIDFKIKASGMVTYAGNTYRIFNVKNIFDIAYIFYMRPI